MFGVFIIGIILVSKNIGNLWYMLDINAFTLYCHYFSCYLINLEQPLAKVNGEMHTIFDFPILFATKDV